MGSVLSGSWLDLAQGDTAQGRQYGKREREAWVLSRRLLCPVARNRPYPSIALLKATAPVGGPCQVPANAPHCSQP